MAELWFTLLICGDDYPIISNLEHLGLISALTINNSKIVIQKIKNILKNDHNFFQFILKIVPIDFVCETNIKVISQIVENRYKEFINDDDTFKIELKRRNNDLIDRDNFIEFVAKNINNQVNLKNPDKIIRIEVLGNYSGISFLKPNNIIKLKSK